MRTGRVLCKATSYQPLLENPDSSKDRRDQARKDEELDARILEAMCLSADHRFPKLESVVLESFACHCENHPVTRRDDSDITALELAAVHHELAVDQLRWFAGFSAEKHWHSSDAEHQQLQV